MDDNLDGLDELIDSLEIDELLEDRPKQRFKRASVPRGQIRGIADNRNIEALRELGLNVEPNDIITSRLGLPYRGFDRRR